MNPIIPLFKSPTIVAAIKHWLALIRGGLVDGGGRLAETELGKAVRLLQYATTNPGEIRLVLQQAHTHFFQAIQHEKHGRLVAVYLGLVLCDASLGNTKGAGQALEQLVLVPLPVVSNFVRGSSELKAHYDAKVASGEYGIFARIVMCCDPAFIFLLLFGDTRKDKVATTDKEIKAIQRLQAAAQKILDDLGIAGHAVIFSNPERCDA